MEGKKLIDLRVVDLRAELEARGVDKSGNKQTLQTRLRQVLVDGGHDPELFVFGAQTYSQTPDTDIGIDEVLNDKESKANINEMKCENNAKNIISNNVKDSCNDIVHEELFRKSDDTESIGSANEGVSAEITGADKIDCEDLDDEQHDLTTEVNEDLVDDNEDDHEQGEERENKEDGKRINEQPNWREGESDQTGEKIREVEKKEKMRGSIEDDVLKNAKKETNANDVSKKIDGGGDIVEAAEKTASNSSTTHGREKTEKKTSSRSDSSEELRSLWISDLRAETCASDIKKHFQDYGKVTSAKVVASPSDPAKFFGLVTMATERQASKALQLLHRSRLLGARIYVERAKKDGTGPLRCDKNKELEAKGGEEKEQESGAKEESKKDKEQTKKDISDGVEKKEESIEKSRDSRSLSRPRSHERKHIPFEEIIRRRENQRLRFREKMMQRDLYLRKRREDQLRREKEQIRFERMRLEREKAELLRLERERQRLERERLERERAELMAHKMRLQASIGTKRKVEERTYSSSSSSKFPRLAERYPSNSSRYLGAPYRGSSKYKDSSRYESYYNPAPHYNSRYHKY